MSRRNSYEGTFIIKPDLSEDEVKKVIEDLSSEIEGRGGSIEKSVPIGKQRLAYRIGKNDDGFFLRVNFQTAPESMKGFTQQLKLNQNIIRHLIIKCG